MTLDIYSECGEAFVDCQIQSPCFSGDSHLSGHRTRSLPDRQKPRAIYCCCLSTTTYLVSLDFPISRSPSAYNVWSMSRCHPDVADVSRQLCSVPFLQPLTYHCTGFGCYFTVLTTQKKKRGETVKDRLQDDKLSNYPEEKRFRVRERHWLGDWTLSPAVSNHRLGGGILWTSARKFNCTYMN